MSVSAERRSRRCRLAVMLAIADVILLGMNLDLGRRRAQLAERAHALSERIAEAGGEVSADAATGSVVPAVAREGRRVSPTTLASWAIGDGCDIGRRGGRS